ncbi:rod shape-determining protein MreC [Patescibacteria group bacterium]|nr:rod shape-determining protein MreC [Patescibacteria group bacterium]
MKKENRKKNQIFIFLVVFSLLLIFLNSVGHLNSPKNYFIYVINSISNSFQISSNNFNDVLNTLSKIDKLKKENSDLRENNLNIKYELSNLKEIKRENDLLKEQLGFANSICSLGGCFNWTMGRITSRESNNFGKSIVINLGKKYDVEEGFSVVAAGGLLIGKVVEVFDDFSKVMLITDSNSSINAIAQDTRANGVIQGSYGTGVRLEMINQVENLVVGDLVITSGLDENIPKGLILGKISTIKESPNQVFKSADIDLFIDLNHIEEIFIARK